MSRRTILAGLIAVSLTTILGRAQRVPGAESEPERWMPVVPARLTVYDIATRRELLYRRQIASAITGNSVSEWLVLDGLEAQLGAWIAPFVEASRISTAISNSFPIGTQEPTRKLDELVHDCARVLGLKKPEVFVRNSPFTVAYVTVVDGRPMLTLTSGLPSLYDGRPRELRFVVGRELGRIKLGHVDERTKAYAIFTALQSVNLAVVPDRYQLALPTLALGRLMSAFREMEFSADRAGLLCCQDTDVAFQAMLRQLLQRSI